jgi:hypothetical protein
LHRREDRNVSHELAQESRSAINASSFGNAAQHYRRPREPCRQPALQPAQRADARQYHRYSIGKPGRRPQLEREVAERLRRGKDVGVEFAVGLQRREQQEAPEPGWWEAGV